MCIITRILVYPCVRCVKNAGEIRRTGAVTGLLGGSRSPVCSFLQKENRWLDRGC